VDYYARTLLNGFRETDSNHQISPLLELQRSDT
jgi:hypothetical protein